MAKSTFVKSADYLAAMVFMFANLVIEFGIVLVVLMGWAVRRQRVHRRHPHDRLDATLGGL